MAHSYHSLWSTGSTVVAFVRRLLFAERSIDGVQEILALYKTQLDADRNEQQWQERIKPLTKLKAVERVFVALNSRERQVRSWLTMDKVFF